MHPLCSQRYYGRMNDNGRWMQKCSHLDETSDPQVFPITSIGYHLLCTIRHCWWHQGVLWGTFENFRNVSISALHLFHKLAGHKSITDNKPCILLHQNITSFIASQIWETSRSALSYSSKHISCLLELESYGFHWLTIVTGNNLTNSIF